MRWFPAMFHVGPSSLVSFWGTLNSLRWWFTDCSVRRIEKTNVQSLYWSHGNACYAGYRYRPYRERSNSLLKSRALQQRLSFFKFFERLLLNNGDGIQHYAQNFNIWTVLEQQTGRRALQQNIAIFSKPDYIFLILTRNQLPSDCKWGNGGRSHGDGTRSKLVGQFPSSLAIFFLTTAICGNLLSIAVLPGNGETC